MSASTQTPAQMARQRAAEARRAEAQGNYNTYDYTPRAIGSIDSLLAAQGINTTAMTPDEKRSLLNRIQTDNYENTARDRDRQNALTDFRAQLADLTGSKQRQAEQAGRIAQANVRAQGLGQMMSNF